MTLPTRAQANELLHLYRMGAIQLTPAEVNRCLYATGDLE